MHVPAVRVRAMTPLDWPQVQAIYEAGIATGNATFELVAPTWESWDAGHLPGHRLVAEADDASLAGWAALSAVSDRCAYAGVAEDSVYIHPRHHGAGVGRLLLEALVAGAEADGLWTIQAGILAENAASIALHERCGFRIVGRRERIGRLHGTWRDTLLLERRSSTIV